MSNDPEQMKKKYADMALQLSMLDDVCDEESVAGDHTQPPPRDTDSPNNTKTTVRPKMKTFLQTMSEPMPAWLAKLSPKGPFPVNDFFASRFVYYPGSGLDGQPVELLGGSHFAHCFLYVDYGVTRERIEAAIATPAGSYDGGFQGYSRFYSYPVPKQALTHRGWQHDVSPREAALGPVAGPPFAMATVLLRDDGLDDKHGPERLAILFLGADGIATYDALFCQAGRDRLPELVVLQDHGFGGNYDRFGQGGLFWELARITNRFPSWLLVADGNTAPWEGYKLIEQAGAIYGGANNSRRRLYRKRN